MNKKILFCDYIGKIFLENLNTIIKRIFEEIYKFNKKYNLKYIAFKH